MIAEQAKAQRKKNKKQKMWMFLVFLIPLAFGVLSCWLFNRNGSVVVPGRGFEIYYVLRR